VFGNLIRVRSIALIAALVASLFTAVEATAFDISIVERGPGSDSDIGLWVGGLGSPFIFTGVNQLVSPSGDVFTASSSLEHRTFNDLVLRFATLADAVDYVQGDWQATTNAFPTPPTGPTTQTTNFHIGAIDLTSINRTTPTLLSPAPGAVIRSGSTFSFNWDYVPSDVPPGATTIVMGAQFATGTSGGRMVVATPHGSGFSELSGSSGSGDHEFAHKMTNVPGATENRWNLTLTAAPLPVGIQMTMGSYFSLTNKISPPQQFPTLINFFYSHENAPFNITLANVPEPSSIGTVILALVCSASIRRHP